MNEVIVNLELEDQAVSGKKSAVQIFLIVLGCIGGMVLGGFLIALTLLASPIITVLILVFLIGYGLTALVSSSRTPK